MSRSSVTLFDLTKLKQEIETLSAEQNEEGFWSDQRAAQAKVNQLNDIRAKVTGYESVQEDYATIQELLADPSANEPDMRGLIEETENNLTEKVHELRNTLLFTGEYDALNATLEIHPGAGGTEAQDWADMLFRMYGRWAEKHGFKWQVYSYEPGEEAGLKSAMVKIWS